MTMPSGNVVISDKMQFSSNVGNAGGEMHNRQWYMDDRDRFISWLRGEFAAANAIIDSLLHHMRSIGEPGEYDVVMGYVQQRRCNWNPVLHMQQYFSIAEVTFALQQAAWKKQQRHFDKGRFPEKDVKKSGSQGVNNRQWFRVENKENHNSSAEYYNPNGVSPVQLDNMESKKGEETAEKVEEAIQRAEVGKLDENNASVAQAKEGVADNTRPDVKGDGASNVKGSCNTLPKNGPEPIPKQNGEANHIIPKTFVGTEILDGKPVNVVEGLKLYGEVFNNSKISSIIQLANELRSSGRRGQLKGQSFTSSKRPMKGRGRDVIQLGVPIEDEGMYTTDKTEPIPSLLQDVIDRLMSLEITTTRPDSCIIDFFNEGDHSQPHICPFWFGRPLCILSLTDCDMSFGRVIVATHPGEYKGSLKLSLLPGNVVSFQGKSADFAKHAISSTRKQRILITFTKSQPSSTWGPPRHVRHPVGPKHFGTATTGVLPLPPPPVHQQHLQPPPPPPPPANNMQQPIFIATASPGMGYSSPVPVVSSGWAAVSAPRHAPPRVPLPAGTGVFLPCNGEVDGKTKKQQQEECNGKVASEQQQQGSDIQNGGIVT